MAHDIHSPLLTLGESQQSAPHLSLSLSSPAHHYWQSAFAAAPTNHGRRSDEAETDGGREKKSDGQRRGSNEEPHTRAHTHVPHTHTPGGAGQRLAF